MNQLEAAYHCSVSCSALRQAINKHSNVLPLLPRLTLSWQNWCAVHAQMSKLIFIVTVHQGCLSDVGYISHAAHGKLLTYRLREVLIEVLVEHIVVIANKGLNVVEACNAAKTQPVTLLVALTTNLGASTHGQLCFNALIA
jgi:hypothetical protein